MASNKDRAHIRKLREEANALREQEEAKRRRTRMMTQLGIVIGAILVVAGIVFFAVMAPTWFGKQNVPEASGTVAVPNSAGEQVEVPISISEAGVVVGDPAAPSTVDYYLDFSCGHCKNYHDVLGHEYQTLVGDGAAKINYHFIQFVNPYGLRAASAMASAVVNDPSSFYRVVDDFFAIDPQVQTAWSEGDYAGELTKLGIGEQAVIDEVRDGHYHWWVRNSTRVARDSGINATPSVVINDELKEALPASREELRAAVGDTTAPAPEAPAPTESAPAAPTATE